MPQLMLGRRRHFQDLDLRHRIRHFHCRTDREEEGIYYIVVKETRQGIK